MEAATRCCVHEGFAKVVAASTVVVGLLRMLPRAVVHRFHLQGNNNNSMPKVSAKRCGLTGGVVGGCAVPPPVTHH